MAQIASRADPAQDLPIGDPALDHLKRLLLIDEHRALTTLKADVSRIERTVGSEEFRQLSTLRAELSRIEGRFGSDERFCQAVASSLIGALKAAEIESHHDLAAVMAPLVVSGIRREIEQSRDTMVETLYPITGRMVTAAVAAMFRQLSDDINQKIEASLSPTLFRLRVRAMITRRPLSALILAEATRGRLQRLLFIERATGAVLATTGPDGLPEPEPASTLHLLGGLVSAIVEFSGHALSDVRGELRQLDFGGQTVFLRASPVCIVAAIAGTGPLSPSLPAFIDTAFLGLLERLRAPGPSDPSTALAGLHRDIADRIAPVVRAKHRVSPLKVITALLAVGLGLWGYEAWSDARERDRQDARLAAIEQSPTFQNDPVHLAFDRPAKVIRADGIVSTRAAFDALNGGLARSFPDWPVSSRIAILSETSQLAALNERISGLSRDLQRQAAAHVQAIDGLRGQVGAGAAEAARRADRDRADLREAIAAIDTPERHLDEIVRGTAIFFEVNGDAYHDPVEATRALKALAEALKPTRAGLRIIGFGDGSGTPQANLAAAKMRADRIATDLRALGIDPARLTTVSTRPTEPLDDQPRSGANRRAVFELAYPGQ